MISYIPFGRGTSDPGSPGAAKAVIQGLYTLGTFPNTRLNDSNFADNAGIPESLFLFNYHTHANGSLGTGVISGKNLLHNSIRSVQLTRASTPGVVAIPGIHVIRLKSGVGHSEVYEIYYAQSSLLKTAFQPGTDPSVLTTLFSAVDLTSIGLTSLRLTVQEAHDTYFVCRVEYSGLSASVLVTIWFLAMGTSPGFLVNPQGV